MLITRKVIQVQAELQAYPDPPDLTHVFLYACRFPSFESFGEHDYYEERFYGNPPERTST